MSKKIQKMPKTEDALFTNKDFVDEGELALITTHVNLAEFKKVGTRPSDIPRIEVVDLHEVPMLSGMVRLENE